MSIPLTGSGGLFTRLGAMGGAVNAVNLQRGTTIPSHVASIQSQFTSTDQDVIDSLYSQLSSYQNTGSTFPRKLQDLAKSTLIQMANDSAPLPSSALVNAMNALIAQMAATSQSVRSCTVGSSVVMGGSNTGNPVVVLSLKDVNGKATELAFAEAIVGTVTSDSQSSTGLAGVEPISLVGAQAVSDSLSWSYPAGSGVSGRLSAVSGLTNSGGGTSNWLKNGSMETFTTANVPDGWHITAGAAGNQVLQITSTSYDGSSCLGFVGDNTTGTAIRQQFSTSAATGDTTVVIYPQMQFAANLWLKVSAVPASGVLRVALSDGTNPVGDNAGNTGSVSVNLATLSATAWTAVNATLRTPTKLPAALYLELELTTPLPTGTTLYVDRVAFAPMSRLYAGGPSLSVFSGNINMIRGDTFTVNITNDYAGQFQILFDKLFSMKSLGLVLPSAPHGSETILDSLIA